MCSWHRPCLPAPCSLLLLTLMPVQRLLHFAQGVIEEVREDNVIRSVREDSESSCVGEIAFFMGIAQPRTFQVRRTFRPYIPGFHPLLVLNAILVVPWAAVSASTPWHGSAQHCGVLCRSGHHFGGCLSEF